MIDFLKEKLPGINHDNLALMNTMYHRGTYDTNWKDSIDLVMKDLETNEKHLINIDEPMVDIYFVKPEFRNYSYNKNWIDRKFVDAKRVKYRNLIFEIAKDGGPQLNSYLQRCKEIGNNAARNNIHKLNRFVFGSDLDIEPLYRIYYQSLYGDKREKLLTLQKTYSDIETDIRDIVGFPTKGNCPICLVSLFDETDMTMHTLILRLPGNDEQSNKLEANIDNMVNDLHSMFDESYGHINYKVYMYDDERELISDYWNLTNQLNRDVNVWWNAGFDIPFFIDRMKVLGMDHVKVMCHPDFKRQECYYYKDQNSFKAAEKSDYTRVSAYTQQLDQMIIYAALRKTGAELRNDKLNEIARIEIKDTKLDYSNSGEMRDLPYTDLILYTLYNIKDVLLQYGIERKTHDLNDLFERSETNVTPINKCFKQTRFLNNVAYKDFFEQGLVIGNNVNINHGSREPIKKKGDKDKVRFAGALVGDPTNNDHKGIYIMGKRSMYVFKWVIDMDFAAMYPSIIIGFNIAPNTLIGKLFIDEEPEDLVNKLNMGAFEDKVYNLESEDGENNEDDNDTLQGVTSIKEDIYGDEATLVKDKGKDFIDNYLTNNNLNTGTKWFNLPTVNEVCDRLAEKFNLDKVA